jgi:mercuric ion transport protein
VRGGVLWRDRWFAVGVLGALLTCLACLTPVAVLVLAAIGLGAWTSRLDVALIPLLIGFVALAVYRYRRRRRA